MLLAPVFGYLGDRYNRRLLMALGVTIWSAFTLLGSFARPSHLIWFFFCRGMVGIGEASYSCIAPSVIGDLYEGAMRTKMLAIYYVAIPLLLITVIYCS
ncbi:hypothetical protein GJ496_001889 [Pomphorhynchus laevis]|nr:hypothetical protein GJ496_001889 [Pomphorhynchus laevis]